MDPNLHRPRETRPRLKVAIVIGTRPEGIKMAPVIRELNRRSDVFETLVVSTSQHHQMLDDVLLGFGITPDITLDVMRPNQALAALASRAMSELAAVFAKHHPTIVLVQGDTTTVAAASLAACYQGIRVGHVEAGLRSFDRQRPFPEETNRRVAGCVADLHFAPTPQAKQNLLREGVPSETVFVTGNTVVDALASVRTEGEFEDPELAAVGSGGHRLLLVTAHRRESQNEALASICEALKALVARFNDVAVVFPVHLNPQVRDPVRHHLANTPRIHLVDPLPYRELLRLMKRCTLILTDSGGIQEEAPSFQKPVLILRDVTERPELVEIGAGKLVGTEVSSIVAATARLLEDPEAYLAMQSQRNPFGDGRAAEHIVRTLLDRLG